MRRLPIFFLVDVSESMAGETLYRLQEGIGSIIATLRQDPHALETVYLAVMVFAGKARTITPLTDLASFYPPELPLGDGTALGAGLEHLMGEIDRSVVTTTPQRKGDWQPVVFLMTDGHPTDDVQPAVAHWNLSWRKRAHLVAVSMGGGGDHTVLKQLTDDVLIFDDTAPEAFGQFIKWLSMSIQSQSQGVQGGREGRVSLAKRDETILAPLNPDAHLAVDDRFAVFIGKCSHKRLPYVVKYERHLSHLQTADPALGKLFAVRQYVYSLVMPVKNSFFELSREGFGEQTVSSEQLLGYPACPYCGARFGMAVCACGKIHCVQGEGPQKCPWCEQSGYYGPSANGESFAIGRGQG